eukprot:TRINITY_DN64382_c0_g1_i1.p1 TRINITY_DN64382_c0_g1~~TRINITY_DN64382_c0_g1_i1.p1  ORF type:complete len:181 (+),score=57.31 TRINITY_DN64382_c0_g1_i1:33-575(+)
MLLYLFFFKQKTAYEMLRSLVGSEMCIRDSHKNTQEKLGVLEYIHGTIISGRTNPDLDEELRNKAFEFEFAIEEYLEMDARHNIEIEYLEGLIEIYRAICQLQAVRMAKQEGRLCEMRRMILMISTRPSKTTTTTTTTTTTCLLYTSDAADEEDSVDLGGRRIIKKKKNTHYKNNPEVGT